VGKAKIKFVEGAKNMVERRAIGKFRAITGAALPKGCVAERGKNSDRRALKNESG